MPREYEGRLIIPESHTSLTIGPEFIDRRAGYDLHLHHSGYLHYFETARIEAFETRGVNMQHLLEEYGLVAPVRYIDGLKFGRELHENDVVNIKSAVSIDHARIIFRQEMKNEGILAASAIVTNILMNIHTRRPERIIPDWIVNKLVSAA